MKKAKRESNKPRDPEAEFELTPAVKKRLSKYKAPNKKNLLTFEAAVERSIKRFRNAYKNLAG